MPFNTGFNSNKAFGELGGYRGTGDGEELGVGKRLSRDLEDPLPPWPYPPSSPRPSDSASPCSPSPALLDGEEGEEESSSSPVSIAFDLCCLWE